MISWINSSLSTLVGEGTLFVVFVEFLDMPSSILNEKNKKKNFGANFRFAIQLKIPAQRLEISFKLPDCLKTTLN